MIRGQAGFEALACSAALLAFILVLGVAAESAGMRAREFSSRLGDGLRAELLAAELDLLAADGRLSALCEADLRGCALTGDGVACGNASAATIIGNSGGGRYGFYGSFPG
ncbi:MAG: hypothetical protein PHF51_03040 [Candidatus ainarchaeum sp.]|nr:hypothetical protein [Candidatus ainarchaeum sp.]